MKPLEFFRSLLARLVPQTSSVATGRMSPMIYTTAGERVDPDTALTQAAVWACVSYLSRTIGQLPWRAMLDDKAGPQPQPQLAVDRLLRLRANPEMSPFTFKETMVWWAATWGNAIAELVPNMRGEITEAWPIEPWRVSFPRDPATGELLYEVSGNGAGKAPVVLKASQVFHLKGIGGAVGLSPIAYAAESIGWVKATQAFASAFFGNAMTPAGLLFLKSRLTPKGKEELEKELDNKFTGAARAHKTVLVDFDGDFKRYASDPQSTQLVDVRDRQIEEVCRWFGVPPHKVMHLLHATFTNIEHQGIEVVTDTIGPWCTRMEEEGNFKFFGANRQGFYTRFDKSELLRGDFKSRQEGYQIMRRSGAINVNQWRAAEGMPGIGPEGEVFIVESNMQTIKTLMNPPKPAAAPAPAAPGQQPPDGTDPHSGDNPPAKDSTTGARRLHGVN